MLDTATKRRIDTARDILVGKVPDPKSQVEQITIALIYKFMDDLDAESEELGGQRKYFSGDFSRYGWPRLVRSGLGGHETLSLYAEAITRMPENPAIPSLFRNIFNNAYLPYRDPETLRAFLKIIDEFNYDHSERLGDAFEYLLSVLGSQGDAGQFRTPRHIIDFIVSIVDPKKDESVLDPACGTAGFLISAYKHILKANRDSQDEQDNKRNPVSDPSLLPSLLTPDEKGKLATSFTGYDISPDMVRLSLVNLYLHGFVAPQIHEYDTLTSEERWNEYADVILANPPFMSPKGGIRPHNRFSVQSKRSEVLFIDYMAEHLTPRGRAGIIVPEGIIFTSQDAYRQLRKMLVENYLVAVISLPAGVFKPYSGVKTSILILDRALAKKSNRIAFFKVENDGFDLGDQRREIAKNDLPKVKDEITEYLGRLRAGEPVTGFEPAPTGQISELGADYTPTLGLITDKEKIVEDGEYNLSGERYRERRIINSKFEMAALGEICEIRKGTAITRKEVIPGSIPVIAGGRSPSAFHNESNRTGETITVSASGAYAGFVNYFNEPIFASDCSTIKLVHEHLLSKFVFHILKAKQSLIYDLQIGMGQPHVYPKDLAAFEIPLPPLEVQREIVAEIEGYQRVIDGARAVIDNYRPQVVIDPEWPMVNVGSLAEIVRGSSPRPKGNPDYYGGPIPRLMVSDITRDGMYVTPRIDSLTYEGAKKSRPMKKGDVIVTVSGNPGLPTILNKDACIHDGFVGLRNLKSDSVLPEFLYFNLLSQHEIHASQSVGAIFKNLTTYQIQDFKIPLPPIEVQQAIVTEIETEEALVTANRKLIDRFEKKIQSTVERVWGKDEAARE